MTTATPPRATLILGYGGLLPAAVLCLIVAAGPAGWRAPALQAHAVYAAVILSFIGGAWWGLASTRAASDRQAGFLVASVLPSLAAWALAMIGGGWPLIGLGLLFAAVLPVDARLANASVAPAWWTRLRAPLSAGMALLALASGLFAIALQLG